MLLVTERDGIHPGRPADDGERGELTVGCKPDFYARQMWIELRRQGIRWLSTRCARTSPALSCYRGIGRSERITDDAAAGETAIATRSPGLLRRADLREQRYRIETAKAHAANS